MSDSLIGKQAEAKIDQWLNRPDEDEIWIPIVGHPEYEGLYMISNLGKVHSTDRYVATKGGTYTKRSGKLLNIHSFDTGYKYVVLSHNAFTTNALLHRLVAEAFIPNPDNKPVVNHKDGDKSNNRVSNLEWSTYQENTQHAIQHGLMKCSDRHHMKMMSNFSNKRKKIKCIETGQIYPSIKDCAKAMNIRLGYLYEYTSNQARSCHGYHFELLE